MEKTTPKWKYGDDVMFSKPSRTVNTVFLHCSSSDQDHHDDISVIRGWHKNERNWSDVGYHFFITKNGDIQEGRSLNKNPAAQKNYNENTMAICVHGLKLEKFTEKQFESVKKLCNAINDAYGNKMRFRGHVEVDTVGKTCPVFNYKSVLSLDSGGHIQKNKPTPATISAIKTNRSTTQLQALVHGEHVKQLQSILNTLGHKLLSDGAYGRLTHEAVLTFQKKNFVPATGIVGPTTGYLLATKLPHGFASKSALKLGSTGTNVLLLQYLLNNFSKTQLNPTGMFNVSTRNAVMMIQKKFKLRPTGCADTETIQILLKHNSAIMQNPAIKTMNG